MGTIEVDDSKKKRKAKKRKRNHDDSTEEIKMIKKKKRKKDKTKKKTKKEFKKEKEKQLELMLKEEEYIEAGINYGAPPILEIPALDYLLGIQETIINASFENEEERDLVVQATLEEIKGKEKAVFMNTRTSHVMEALFPMLEVKQLRNLLHRLEPSFIQLCTDTGGSHSLEALLRRIPSSKIVGKSSGGMPGEGIFEDVTGNSKDSILDILGSFCEMLLSDLSLMHHHRACFIFRDLLLLSTGVQPLPKKGGGKNRRVKVWMRKMQRIPVSKGELSEFARRCGEECLKLNDLADYVFDSRGASTLAVLLETLSSTKKTHKLRDKLIAKCLGWKDTREDVKIEITKGIPENPSVAEESEAENDSDRTTTKSSEVAGEAPEQEDTEKSLGNNAAGFEVPAEAQEVVTSMIFDDSASFWMEAALALASEELISLLFQAHLKGNIPAIVRHRCANFVGQALFQRLAKFRETDWGREALESVFMVMQPNLEQLCKNRVGVISALAKGCAPLGIGAEDWVRVAKILVGNTSENLESLPLDLLLFNKNLDKRKKTELSVTASLLLSALLSLPHEFCFPLGKGVLNLPKELLVATSKDPLGSRVMEAFFLGNSKQRSKVNVMTKLKEHHAELACDRCGSFVIETAFWVSKYRARTKLAKSLSKSLRMLEGDKIGARVAVNLKLKLFLSSPEHWAKAIKS